jgi:VWFA-related protein
MKLARALGLAMLAAVAFGRQATQDRPDTVIRTTTRLVQVRVVAEDSQGRPAAYLRKEDFHLEDDGKAQPIALFATDGSSLPASETGASASPPEDSAARNDYAMILLDWLNPRYADRLSVLDHVRKLLAKFQPRQMVALYLMGHESYLVHDFTSDNAELLQSLADLDPGPYDGSRGAVNRLDAQNGGDRESAARLSVEEQIFDFNRKVLDTLATLGKVADGLARIPGRKSLIWVSNGFPIVLDGHAVRGAKPAEISYGKDVETAIGKFNRADAAVYTVDARGLPAVPSYGDVATLQEFSARTGGTTFCQRNDLDEGMRLALEDMKISYTLGFAVPVDDGPGLHQIRLTTTRPGINLRYRESYQLDDAAAPPPKPRKK